MSGSEGNLRSSLLKSRIAKLSHLPAIAPFQRSSSHDGAEQQEESDDVGSLTMAAPLRSSNQRNAESRSLDALYSPLSAADCFQEALQVDLDDSEGNSDQSTFRIYYTSPRKTSSKSSRMDTLKAEDLDSLSLPDAIESSDTDSIAGTVFFFHHGAGYSALSYALVAKHMTELSKGEAGVLAFDCRGHGEQEKGRWNCTASY
jgi:protein phosphatase methylesterase 1